jgi:hypothetical protein
VNLHAASNSHPNEDFTLAQDGTVSQFCGAQLARTSVACLRYAGSEVLELNWTPFGNQTGLCAGTAGPVRHGTNVTLRPCGRFEGTLLIVDSDHAAGGYAPLIDGADASFSHPAVLTVDPGTRRPEYRLRVEPENTLTGGVIPDSQLLKGWPGPVA